MLGEKFPIFLLNRGSYLIGQFLIFLPDLLKVNIADLRKVLCNLIRSLREVNHLVLTDINSSTTRYDSSCSQQEATTLRELSKITLG